MNISVKFPSSAAKTLEFQELALEFQTDEMPFEELLQYFKVNYPVVFRHICTPPLHIHPSLICMKNSTIVMNKDMRTEKIQDGDIITFSLAIAGGCNQ